MQLFKKILVLIGTVAISAFFAGHVFAADVSGVPIDPSLHPKGSPTISGEVDSARLELTARIVNVVLGLAGIIAIYFIVTNGFMIIISAGKEETITQHKKGLMWAVVGLILIMLSYSIVRFVITLTFIGDEPPKTEQS